MVPIVGSRKPNDYAYPNMPMKKILCLLLFAGSLCGRVAAQERSSASVPCPVVGVELRGDTLIYRPVCGWDNQIEDATGRHYRLLPVKGLPGPRHALSLEVGALPACGIRSIVPETGCDESFYGYPGSFPGERRYYSGPLRMSGAVSAVYTYRARRWLEVGGSVTYAGFYRNFMHASDRRVAFRQREHYLALMPVLRFSWFNSRTVRLYSTFQLGWQLGFEKYSSDRFDTFHYAAIQVTPLGISVGRRIFGYAEIGIGMRGVLVGGIGYRFGNTK